MAGSAGPRREAGGPAAHADRGLTKLRLTVEYDGTEFCGFQWQPAARTVAGVLEAALARLFAERVKIAGAGRTDRGVHASGQVVSLATARPFPFERLTVALNALLPMDCTVRDAAMASPDFSARFSARRRTYVYAILNRPEPNALLSRYVYHVPPPLKIAAMREGGSYLVGTHDFRSFCASAALGQGSTVRTVHHLTTESLGELIRIEIAADGFLHHMVRTIVGTLLECGRGRRDPSELPAVLAALDRSAAGTTAPAQALCLAGVRYDDGYDSFAEPPVFGGPSAQPLDG